jgi:peptidoglycan hydrolase-like protein with peptidoglycan-binding domain
MSIKYLMHLVAAMLLASCMSNPLKQPAEQEAPAETVQKTSSQETQKTPLKTVHDAPTDKKQLVTAVQTMLSEKGYDPGPIDGLVGPSTNSALKSFQSARGLPFTAGITKESYVQLANDSENYASTQNTQEVVPSKVVSSKNITQECILNFTKESGYKKFRTTVTLDDVDQQLATKRLVRALSRKGFVINDKDESEGIVNATFDAGDADLQLAAFIDQKGQGSHAELNYGQTGASAVGWLVSNKAYQNELCDFAEAMSKGN